jgi:hypothetical protein
MPGHNQENESERLNRQIAELEIQVEIVRLLAPLQPSARKAIIQAVEYLLEADKLLPGTLQNIVS